MKTKNKLLNRIFLGVFLLTSSVMFAQTNTSPFQTVCAGSLAEPYLINPPTSGSTYQWSMNPVGGTMIPGSTTDNITVDWGIVPGVYIISVIETDANGCDGLPLTVDVTVVSLPTVVANTSLSSPLCEGDQLTLSGSGAGGAIYTWDNSVIDNTPFTPPVGTVTYTVTADLNGCTATDNITITVNPVPTVVANANPSSPLCEGDQLTLSGSGTSGSTYTWDNSVIDNTPFTPPVGTVTYTVTADLNGCTATYNITITVNPAPITGPIYHN